MLNINNLLESTFWILLILICYSDIRYRIISNKILIFLFLTIFILYIRGDGIFNYIPALIFLVIGIVIFQFGLAGAGDIKLISVLMFSIPSIQIMSFFILIAFCGLPLAFIMLLIKIISKNKKTTLPYGVAISFAYLLITL